jgi:integrase
MRTWTTSKLRSFLNASVSSDDRYQAAWMLLATTGARRGEVLGLRWDDLDLDVGRASIEQTVIAVRHAVQFGTPKTAKGARTLRLDAGTVAALKAHRTRQLEERMAVGPGYCDHGLVFAKVDGEPLHPERFSREFDRRVERWGLPRIRLHDLRHTWATLALEANVPAKVVSERLGHANISVTMDIYSHVTEAMDAGAAETVAGLIFGAAPSR